MSVYDEDMFQLADEDVSVAGTFIDLAASVRSASIAEYDLLRQPGEVLGYADMEFVANAVQGASKLAGSGWKKTKPHKADLYPGSQPSKDMHKSNSKSVLDESTSLADCLNLEDALQRFDLDKDDKLDEREQTALYRTVQREMLEHLDELHAQRRHHEAHVLFQRLKNLRKEVLAMAASHEEAARRKQLTTFGAAKAAMRRELRSAQAAHRGEAAARLDALKQDLRHRHAIERELLERELEKEREARVKKKQQLVEMNGAGGRLDPTAKPSKKYLELADTERKLAKGHEYRDAALVKRRVDRLEGPEAAKAEAAFEARQQRRRAALAAEHRADAHKAVVRRVDRVWRDRRLGEAQWGANEQRLKNHAQDMAHAHLLDRRTTPEFSAAGPSALRTKRRGHGATGAAFRGTQLLSAARRGRFAVHDPRDGLTRHPLAPVRSVDFLSTAAMDGFETPDAAPHGPHMPGLTESHDFVRPLDGTYTAFETTKKKKKKSSMEASRPLQLELP